MKWRNARPRYLGMGQGLYCSWSSLVHSSRSRSHNQSLRNVWKTFGFGPLQWRAVFAAKTQIRGIPVVFSVQRLLWPLCAGCGPKDSVKTPSLADHDSIGNWHEHRGRSIRFADAWGFPWNSVLDVSAVLGARAPPRQAPEGWLAALRSGLLARNSCRPVP
jgi:hypothetical protein